MGKRYIMIVDERGFLSTEANDNLSMVGVVFEYDYCIELKNKECELRKRLREYKKEIFNDNNVNLHLDDIMLQEKFYKSVSKIQRSKVVNELPQLFKSLNFTILSTTIKQDTNKVNNSYSIVAKKLFKKFYSYIVKQNGESGGIIIETRVGNSCCRIQQNFFDIYNDREMSLCALENIQDKINTFIVCERNNKTYGSGIEVLNVINNILFRVSNGLRDVDKNIISYTEYGKKNKIFDVINQKIAKDTQREIPIRRLPKTRYNNINEVRRLKEQLVIKDTRVNEKEKEINELTDEIKLLNKQLEDALLSRKSDSIIFQILSDIDFKMKGIEKKAMVVKN
jgi:hypothetical protein